IAASADGRFAVPAPGKAALVCPSDGTGSTLVLTGHTGHVSAVAFHPQRPRLLSAGADGTVRVWDTASGAEAGAFDWRVGPLTAVAVAPDGLSAAVAGRGGHIVTWDLDP
ncbi:unnamed protein product, partial [Phaeothamnion confervicola]